MKALIMKKEYHKKIQELLEDGWKKKFINGHYISLQKDNIRLKVALATGNIVSRKEMLKR